MSNSRHISCNLVLPDLDLSESGRASGGVLSATLLSALAHSNKVIQVLRERVEGFHGEQG